MLDVLGFDFDVDSLCNCVRIIVCIACFFKHGFFFNSSEDANIFLNGSAIKSFMFM